MELNRAVALSEVEGPAAGLAAVDDLPLQTYYLFHAVRADLLRRSGRLAEAVAAYDSGSGADRTMPPTAFLERAPADRSGLTASLE